ncbi:MAG: BrnA antitoxin family protein [Moraxellaceae bacterium]|jgi:uncharacterized protein (DUF4415 family)|nr:BrnA antitoxin family protein [Moraxellaceae bacterium]HQV80617.1 BrnA antitoxin family protein [Agitococcus sp.]MBK7301356.1 BrnA antitoxin family protein [Moraxellaceae bacterium]MBK8327468.1 BrnA antitoxin family protein [Moraxellaceae bacterium]MBK9185074.1 BrnA antitoxin family protein [Moraxellaceae bacterium]
MKLKNPLSADELERQIAAISNIKDEEINTSDIPLLTNDFFKNAIVNPYYKPVKKQLTVRLDAVLIEWLKGQGKGYQTRLNDILKKAMIEDLKHN